MSAEEGVAVFGSIMALVTVWILPVVVASMLLRPDAATALVMGAAWGVVGCPAGLVLGYLVYRRLGGEFP